MKRRCLTALPVFNEESHVARVLQEVGRFADDVLIVDDGSTDHTPEILRDLDGAKVVAHPENRGYGAALVSAFEYTLEHGYESLVTIDCDGQHQPRLIPELIAELFPSDRRHVDIVSGSRYLQIFAGDSTPPADRRGINVAITQQLNEQLGLEITDAFCGFKAYRADALRKFDITETGYAMPLQLWVQAARQAMTIVEFPIPLVYLEEERSFGGSLDDADRRMAYYQEVLQREFSKESIGCGRGG